MQVEICDVMRAMGLFEPGYDIGRVKRAAWTAGAAMARQYRYEFGTAPPQQLRPKTFGTGTHLKSMYPPSWRPRVEAAINAALE